MTPLMHIMIQALEEHCFYISKEGLMGASMGEWPISIVSLILVSFQ